MIEITDVRSLRDRIGKEIAVGEWFEITQARIDRFAEATGDAQWIHVDAARAAAESPFKTTIAHGFLTLSLLSALIRDAMRFHGLRMAINYGMNRMRFVAPVPAGARGRARVTPAAGGGTAGSVQGSWRGRSDREHTVKTSVVAAGS